MRRGLLPGRPYGAAYTAAVYAAALAVAVWTGHLVGPAHPLVLAAAGDVAATFVVFLFSFLADNSSVYDPYWSLQPVAIGGYYLWLGGGGADRRLLVAVLLLAYSVRLTSNFYRDWPGLTKEDFRYVRFRLRYPRAYWPVSFLGIHLFPTVLVYLGCLPLYPALTQPGDSFSAFDLAGALMVAGAIALAFVADEQLRSFRNDPANAGRAIGCGLWRRSRHPNYLGEIGTWWGLWVFALAAGPAWWWTGIGALAITLLFVLVSVPLMETRAMRTRGGYAAYRRSTPMLLPFRWPPGGSAA